MFILNLHVQDCPLVTLHYDTRAAALEKLAALRTAEAGTTIDLTDDHDHHISIPRSRLLVPELIDTTAINKVQVELAVEANLAQARGQAEFQKRVDTIQKLATPGLMNGQFARPQ